MRVDLGASYSIHSVKIYGGWVEGWAWFDFEDALDPRCWQSLYNFKTCNSKENNVDISVYKEGVQQKSCGTLVKSDSGDRADQIYTFPCGLTEGDSIKLSKAWGAGEVVAVNEIVVVGGQGCPVETPYAYHHHQYCCAVNREATNASQGEQCDGSEIQEDSLCCAGNSIPCPSGNNYCIHTKGKLS